MTLRSKLPKLFLASSLLLAGCTTVHIPEETPPGGVVININYFQYKSNQGDGNTLDQKTDANTDLTPGMFGVEEDTELTY
jgi:hypothetical protein